MGDQGGHQFNSSSTSTSSSSACSSFENIRGHQSSSSSSSSLHDIFQYLSEVPLLTHASVTRPEYYHSDAPTSEGLHGPSPLLAQEGSQTHDQGPEVKNVDEAKARTKGKQPVEPERIPIPHQQLHESLRKRSQKRSCENRRRKRINAKMRELQMLLPNYEKVRTEKHGDIPLQEHVTFSGTINSLGFVH
ncbi:uncharacterized protein LOC104895901 isoform X2 [Beta vulgaris subsp. vulgaris]|uniref:uncharacterized protein LOC104895901 isoform X2 n=1 Tax=Beta vulgaris subsp. vulgaris TaxID=3555 RepID=UPI0020370DE7|nr:uncharacterized protein LOC104895901 isoform X2 [Beta vulgaris subsp. vulgaris]